MSVRWDSIHSISTNMCLTFSFRLKTGGSFLPTSTNFLRGLIFWCNTVHPLHTHRPTQIPTYALRFYLVTSEDRFTYYINTCIASLKYHINTATLNHNAQFILHRKLVQAPVEKRFYKKENYSLRLNRVIVIEYTKVKKHTKSRTNCHNHKLTLGNVRRGWV